MELTEAIRKRYSCRGPFRPGSVPRNDLQAILEAGLAAPSGCNRQTVSLIGVDDPSALKRLAELLGKPGFASAPAAVCVLSRRPAAGEEPSYRVQDYAAAVENMLLAITALGYASCWVEGYVKRSLLTGEGSVAERMAKALGVPGNQELVVFLPVGVPAGKTERAVKKTFGERAWFNRFGQSET